MRDERQLERLKWRSRRGLLELDLVFTRFWADHGVQGEAEMQALDRLLQLPDNDLLDLIMERRECADATLAPLVRRLRNA